MDYNYRKIPDVANLSLFVLRFLLIPIGFELRSDAILGALAMFAVFFYVAFRFNVPIGGDIKAVTVTALFFGIGLSAVINMIALAVSLAWYYFKKEEILRNKKHIPYGAMLMVSFLMTMPGVWLYLKWF